MKSIDTILIISFSRQVTATLKYLSTVFRRRLLLVTIPPTKKAAELYAEYGLSASDLPALVVVSPSGDRIKYEAGDFTRRKLESFLAQHALKDPVFKPKTEQEAEAETDPKLKVEL